jgi:hypothetical protein
MLGVASACSGSLLGCLRGAWWVVRTSQRTVRTGNDLMNRFLATPGEELEVKVALGKRLRVNVLLTELYTRYVLQSARRNLRRRPTRDTHYHECLQIPHDLFQLTFAPSHLLPQSGFAGADNSLRPVRYL